MVPKDQTEKDQLVETGVKINKALFDKDPNKLIELLTEFMIKHDLRASESIIHLIHCDDTV